MSTVSDNDLSENVIHLLNIKCAVKQQQNSMHTSKRSKNRDIHYKTEFTGTYVVIKTKYVLVQLWFLSLNYFSKHISKGKKNLSDSEFTKASILETLTGRSTLTSVPSSKDTRQVMIDVESPAAGMCVVARWASRKRAFSACLRMERRPSVLRRKLSMMWEREGYSTTPVKKRGKMLKTYRKIS